MVVGVPYVLLPNIPVLVELQRRFQRPGTRKRERSCVRPSGRRTEVVQIEQIDHRVAVQCEKK